MRFLKTSLIVGATTILLALGVAAQTPSPQPPGLPSELTAKLARLRDAALTSDYAWRQVKHLTENIGPRLAGSRQSEAAVSYVADELRQLGLEVKLEEVMVPHWVRGEEKAELTIISGTGCRNRTKNSADNTG
jgi:carboxypeptidase Q